MSTKLDDINKRAREFSDAREKLAEYVRELNDGIEALKRDNLPKVRRALNRAAQLQEDLKAAVEDAPEHFTKPKTLVLHGIKVGYGKGRGSIEWADDSTLIKAIRKQLPDQFDVLVKTTEKPLKTPLAQLTADQLRKLGVKVEETGNVVIVRAVDSEVEKLVTALLKGVETEAQED
jgi:hypothetical protein